VSDKKHRVCILTTDSSWGGTENMIAGLIRGLSRNFSVTLATLKGDNTLIEKAAPYCEQTFNLNLRSPWNAFKLQKLMNFLRNGKFDVLHTFLFHANILGRVLGRLADIPVIISSQRSIDAWRKYRHVLMDRWTAAWADHIVSNSAAGKKRLESVEKISPDKISVIYNGVFQNSSPVTFKPRVNGPPVIGMVGNFRGMKGHDVFIEAADLLLQEGHDLRFIIAGEGDERGKYEKLVRSLSLQGQISFLGFVSPIEEALQQMDVFVLPSDWEGFPVSILEAINADVPVIATQVGGIPEIIIPEETGLLIPPRDAPALKEGILRVLEDTALRKKIIHNAKEMVSTRFTHEKMVDTTKHLYLNLIAKKK
jgi:glycosyltransferase involved in cell wall biosynthesis